MYCIWLGSYFLPPFPINPLNILYLPKGFCNTYARFQILDIGKENVIRMLLSRRNSHIVEHEIWKLSSGETFKQFLSKTEEQREINVLYTL